MELLKYGNTNTYYIPGPGGGLLIDTDLPGTLGAFYKELKRHGIRLERIGYVLATHYHPDHIGLVSDLMAQGVKLLLPDVQRPYVHYADPIFLRDPRLRYTPIREAEAVVIQIADSRAFLQSLGICGEILSTPSHSPDSISLVLDNGDCFAGDLEPLAYLGGYPSNEPLRADWNLLQSFPLRRVFYGHANETIFSPDQGLERRMQDG